MAYLDIFNPQISVVPKGVEGKTMLIYGSNSTGKSYQSTKAPKPFYLGFERGINAISGIPFLPINSWVDFKVLNSQLTNPYTMEKAKAIYSTLIFDTLEASSIMCQQYVCAQYDVMSIGQGNKGYGLWKEYETEYWTEINKLTNAGYTVIFISHDTTRTMLDDAGVEYPKIFPSGDKRAVDPICNLVDLILYVRPNGMDASGEEILSSAYIVNTPTFLSRSRFKYMPKKLPVFTMENVIKALADAIEKEEKEKGVSSVDYSVFKQSQEREALTLEQMQEAIGEQAMVFMALDKGEDYFELVKKFLPNGKVSEAKKTQSQQIEMIMFELEKLYATLTQEEIALGKQRIAEQNQE